VHILVVVFWVDSMYSCKWLLTFLHSLRIHFQGGRRCFCKPVNPILCHNLEGTNQSRVTAPSRTFLDLGGSNSKLEKTTLFKILLW